MIDEENCWQAFEARDRAADGQFVVAVRTTGIYCKPSCPARRPKRENVSFHPSSAVARAAGFRACRRCLPDAVGRDREAVATAARLLAAGEVLPLAALAGRVGYAPHHFLRLFQRETGLTPAAYARARRRRGAAEALSEESNVTDAIYAAGYAGPSRFYADADRLGMRPSAWARGGDGVAIHWTMAATSLGPLLVAATDRGLCRVAFEEDAADLVRRFPRADIEAGGPDLDRLAAEVVALVEDPRRAVDLPRDVRGTAFQEAVWRALAMVPAGETRSYADLAALAGRPGASRATGSACGANPLAIVTPCHRARRGDGTAGGYAWGLERKATLLEREAVNAPSNTDS